MIGCGKPLHKLRLKMSSPISWDVNGFDDLYVSGMSNCCGAPVYGDTDICTECGEHCEIEEEEEENEH